MVPDDYDDEPSSGDELPVEGESSPEDASESKERIEVHSVMELEFEELEAEVNRLREKYGDEDAFESVARFEDFYYIWSKWADFHLELLEPEAQRMSPAKRILPAVDKKTQAPEHVYPILDWGDRLSASVGEDLAKGSRAMGKLLNTVEKMVLIALERLREEDDGTGELEIEFGFAGHEIAQRKAFQVCLDTGENINVDFDPGPWGERRLRALSYLVKEGYWTIPEKLTMKP